MRRYVVAGLVAAGGGARALPWRSGGGSAAPASGEPRRSSPLARTEVAAARIGSPRLRRRWIRGEEPDSTTLSRRRATTCPARQVGPHAAAARRGQPHGDRGLGTAGSTWHGGYTAPRDLSAGLPQPFYRYDPRRDRWRRLRKAHRRRAARTRCRRSTAGCMRVGGVDPGGATPAGLEIYDIRRNRWSAGPGDAHPARAPGQRGRPRATARPRRPNRQAQGTSTSLEAYDPRSASLVEAAGPCASRAAGSPRRRWDSRTDSGVRRRGGQRHDPGGRALRRHRPRRWSAPGPTCARRAARPGRGPPTAGGYTRSRANRSPASRSLIDGGF